MKRFFDNFARFFEHIGGGDANALLSNDMQELAKHLAKLARDEHQIVKGKIVITLDFVAEPKGKLDVFVTRKSTLPKADIPDTVLWLNERGEITWENPKQPNLPGLATVRESRTPLAHVPNDNTNEDGDDDEPRMQ